MPTVSFDTFAAWSNYHLTVGENPIARCPEKGSAEVRSPFPSRTITTLARAHTSDVTTKNGLRRLNLTGKTLLDYIGKLNIRRGNLPTSGPLKIGMVGRGWSFSPLIGTRNSTLQCLGLAGTGSICESHIKEHPNTPHHSKIAISNGGTRLREIVSWAREEKGLSIKTSGTHLGMTIAGGFGTASHGSRLYYGGIQNMILGIHLIVSPKKHVWIERATKPILNNRGIQELQIPGSQFECIRNDQKFDDALVHLGAMGIVNGVAIELIEDDTFAVMKRKEEINGSWLQFIQDRNFDGIAQRLKCSESPIFYEITIDPQKPFTKPAAHIMYFPIEGEVIPESNPADAKMVRVSDAISSANIDSSLIDAQLSEHFATPTTDGAPLLQDNDCIDALRLVLRDIESGVSFDTVLEFYQHLLNVEGNDTVFDPELASFKGGWSDIHEDEITGNLPGALYNASYAIELEKIATVIPLICSAVVDLPSSFVFTLRFVFSPDGTLSFTRFSENAVIEIDGLSPLACDLKILEIFQTPTSHRPNNWRELVQQFSKLKTVLPEGNRRIKLVLDAEDIPYSMHWAKLGDLDKSKVYSDFGDPTNSNSKLHRWRSTREEILRNSDNFNGLAAFRNDLVEVLGLVDP